MSAPLILLILILVCLFVYAAYCAIMAVPQWRRVAVRDGSRSSLQHEADYQSTLPSSGGPAVSPIQRPTQFRKRTIILKSGSYRGIHGLAIRFGKDEDFVDGFTLKVQKRRFQLPDCVLSHSLSLEHSVTLCLNPESGRLEIRETLSKFERLGTHQTTVITRTAWVHANHFVVLGTNNQKAKNNSTDFTFQIMLKAGMRFRMATVSMKGAGPEQARLMLLKIFESRLRRMQYLEVSVPKYQKKNAFGNPPFDENEVREALHFGDTKSEAFGANNCKDHNVQFESNKKQEIRICFPDHSIAEQNSVPTTSEANLLSSTTLLCPAMLLAYPINLISDYKQPHLTRPEDFARCAAGADLEEKFEHLTIDDKLIHLDRRLKHVAVQQHLALESMLLWIEGYERAIELDESDVFIGKGYVSEQTYALGQLECPYALVDLLYIMARCRLEKRRRSEVWRDS